MDVDENLEKSSREKGGDDFEEGWEMQNRDNNSRIHFGFKRHHCANPFLSSNRINFPDVKQIFAKENVMSVSAALNLTPRNKQFSPSTPSPPQGEMRCIDESEIEYDQRSVDRFFDHRGDDTPSEIYNSNSISSPKKSFISKSHVTPPIKGMADLYLRFIEESNKENCTPNIASPMSSVNSRSNFINNVRRNFSPSTPTTFFHKRQIPSIIVTHSDDQSSYMHINSPEHDAYGVGQSTPWKDLQPENTISTYESSMAEASSLEFSPISDNANICDVAPNCEIIIDSQDINNIQSSSIIHESKSDDFQLKKRKKRKAGRSSRSPYDIPADCTEIISESSSDSFSDRGDYSFHIAQLKLIDNKEVSPKRRRFSEL